MGSPLDIISTGINAVGTGVGLFAGKPADQTRINLLDPNMTTDEGTWSRMDPSQKGAWLTKDQYLQLQEIRQQEKLNTELGQVDSKYAGVDEELNNYEQELMNSFMKTASPQVRQWAYERGVAGGTPDQELMAKTIAEGAGMAMQKKFDVQNTMQNQRNTQKNFIMDKYKTTKMGTALPNMTTPPQVDWSQILKGLSTDLSTYSIYDKMYNNQKTSPKDTLSFDKLDFKDDPLANFKIGLGGE